MPQFIEALTGVPLSVMRRPTGAAAPRQLPTGNSSKSDENAFAQTWDSEHGPKVAMASSPEPAAAAENPPDHVEKPGRKWSVIVGLALVSGVAIAGVTYVATRQRPTQGSQTQQPGVNATEDKPVAVPVTHADAMPRDAAPTPGDASAGRDAAGTVVTTQPDPPPRGPTDGKTIDKPDKGSKKPPLKPPVADAAPNDETSAQKLKDSEAALRDKAYSRAEQLANSVITSEAASRTQKAHAYTIRGVVDCVQHNNEERARIALRQLAGFPRLRKRLTVACQAEGHLRAN